MLGWSDWLKCLGDLIGWCLGDFRLTLDVSALQILFYIPCSRWIAVCEPRMCLMKSLLFFCRAGEAAYPDRHRAGASAWGQGQGAGVSPAGPGHHQRHPQAEAGWGEVPLERSVGNSVSIQSLDLHVVPVKRKNRSSLRQFDLHVVPVERKNLSSRTWLPPDALEQKLDEVRFHLNDQWVNWQIGTQSLDLHVLPLERKNLSSRTWPPPKTPQAENNTG